MFDYSPAADLLADRNILITGAGDGIGRALAMSCAAHGAQVILLGKTQSKLESVYDEIESSSPGKAIIHPLDLETANIEDYALLASSVDEHWGRLDGLVHNASQLGARSPIQFYPDSDWTRLMQVNVNAVFAMTKALLPSLLQSPHGRLLFTSSSVGRQSRAHWGAYAVSKFALEGLMQTMADELERTSKIRINSINPGATKTKMRKDAFPAEDPQSLPTAQSLMPVYLYLLGPLGTAFHGQAVNVRGFEEQLEKLS